jgi:hypothetical protein
VRVIPDLIRDPSLVVAAEVVDFAHDGLQRGFVGVGLVLAP